MRRMHRHRFKFRAHLEGLLGANIDQDNLERDNWSSMETILSKFQTLRSQRRISQDIIARWWGPLEGKDALYFLSHNFHCYVLLYVHNLQAAYIADGGNLFRTEQKVADEIRRIVKIRLISVAYDQQLKVDHCASSAILVGIELIRMHTKGLRHYRLVTNKSYRERIMRSLHQASSQPLPLPSLGERRNKLTCPHCDKTYKSTQRRNYNLHIIRQHKNEDWLHYKIFQSFCNQTSTRPLVIPTNFLQLTTNK